MTAKEYLNRVRRQNYILKQTEKELNEIRADILTLRASSLSEHVSGSKNSDTADKYIRLESYMEKVNAEWDKLIDMRNAAKDLIGAMPDPMHRAVLYARYINGQRWEDIAMDMHYSWKGIFKLHGQALRVFDQMHGDKLS
ncbi:MULTISPECIES: DUF1492 domain-containing protein [Megasphaera]|jgi:hypothetical protein|uniref:DUF1492 domain-containing protein n=1 Tax=Megasphaera TaxID=906 RepID=UPI0009224A4B|nr:MULTISPECIES: DUF1492 domain-containing protein [Megasphaera]DAQ57797.1 MAG TPA: Protein of unknown function (DUF1492) [Caudoviricetes sp.]MCI7201229.1 DUF1492 domain-containing protein [Megasphaera elsdenii]MCQ4113722.1 DUF1492 domain-containing protein [Megasphaera sp. SC8-1]MDY4265350.1 DUF1492 domain-containing protein [Megasphaera elsdenii]SHK45558.1 Protein of unknown function [Megasphaera elsdenii]